MPDQTLRYPIGPFEMPTPLTDAIQEAWLLDVQQLPRHLRQAINGLTKVQLDTPYRPQGWTVRQVVHHLVDSHLNAYQRLKLTLTEQEPNIRTYDEKAWAELADAKSGPVILSLPLLDALHTRLFTAFTGLDDEAWERTFRHPAWGVQPLTYLLGMYAWHGRHHVAHITSLRSRMSW